MSIKRSGKRIFFILIIFVLVALSLAIFTRKAYTGRMDKTDVDIAIPDSASGSTGGKSSTSGNTSSNTSGKSGDADHLPHSASDLERATRNVPLSCTRNDLLSRAPLLHSCRYYNDNDFKRSVNAASTYDTGNRRITAGIVPHHLLADQLISSFFLTLSAQDPELVVLIGPNHKRAGQKKIHTGKWNWQTPFGVLETDSETADRIIEQCGAGEDFGLLGEDHAIAALIPYIKYYLPGAKVISILLHGDLGLKASKQLAGEISKAADGRKWVVVGSVDFSHYLPPEAADKMDEITLKAIRDRDLEAISRMGNDNLDSPPAVMTVLTIANREKTQNIIVPEHSNSARIAGKHSDSTTSYFTMLFAQ